MQGRKLMALASIDDRADVGKKVMPPVRAEPVGDFAKDLAHE